MRIIAVLDKGNTNMAFTCECGRMRTSINARPIVMYTTQHPFTYWCTGVKHELSDMVRILPQTA